MTPVFLMLLIAKSCCEGTATTSASTRCSTTPQRALAASRPSNLEAWGASRSSHRRRHAAHVSGTGASLILDPTCRLWFSKALIGNGIKRTIRCGYAVESRYAETLVSGAPLRDSARTFTRLCASVLPDQKWYSSSRCRRTRLAARPSTLGMAIEIGRSAGSAAMGHPSFSAHSTAPSHCKRAMRWNAHRFKTIRCSLMFMAAPDSCASRHTAGAEISQHRNHA